MTLDDTQSPLQQHSPETDNYLPDSQNLNFTEIEHLPKTLTLDPQITQHPTEGINPTAAVLQEEDLQQVEAQLEPQPQPDMSLASPIRAVTDSHVVASAVSKATSSRRGQKRKRVNKKQLVAIQQKVQILTGNLKLFPFVPNRALDFASHENLLKHLGLWDFVHIELDNSNLRVDLIAQLVVNYKRLGRISEVNGVRIKVSRADLGRALKLPPVKKDNNGVVMIIDDDAGLVAEKSVRFIEELMSNWMLLHDEDTWILPEEVMHWIEMIRKGHPDRVEWASLMWFMVEKELSQGVRLVDCYYASHLQHLIKHQNEKLFLAKPDEDVNVREEEEEEVGGDVEMVDEVEEHVATAVSKDLVDNKMAFTLSNEHEAVSEDRIDEKMAFTLSNEHEAVSEDRIDENMAFTLSNKHEAVSEDCIDEKMAFTLSNEHEAVNEDCIDDKMAFTLSSEHEAASEDRIDDKMAFTLSSEHEAASEDGTDDKMAFMLSKEHEAEKMGIDVNEVCSDEKISEDIMCVKDNDANNDTHMKEFSTHIEIDKSDGFQDLQNACPEVKSEEPNIELTLGQDNIMQDGIENDTAQSDNVMNFDDLGLGDADNWQLDESNAEGEPFLQPCRLDRDKDSVDVVERVEEDVIKEEEVDDDDEEEEVDEEEEIDDDDYDNDEEAGGDERIHHPDKFDSLQDISSAHMFQGVGISQGAFGSPLPLISESHLQHFSSPGGTSSIANTLKRTTNHDHNLSHRTVTDESRRFGCDTWNHQEPSDFYRCMENIEHWMGKAKMMYAAKEQECTQMGMNQQLLYGEVEQRNHMIEHQEKITNEVRQKSQMEIYKLEHELFVMGGLLDSYRKALKETRREFSEYRARYSLPEEPLYKDAGPGGIVLSVAELERQRIKQEEEDEMKHLELESTIKSFEVELFHVFEGHGNDVQKLDEKLLLLENNVKLLKCLPQNVKAEEVTEQPVKTED